MIGCLGFILGFFGTFALGVYGLYGIELTWLDITRTDDVILGFVMIFIMSVLGGLLGAVIAAILSKSQGNGGYLP